MKAARFALLLLLIVACNGLPSLRLLSIVAPIPLLLAQAAPSLPTRNTTIQRIRNRGNLMIVGVLFDYPPFGYLGAQGEVAGFKIELVRAIAQQWQVDVQFVPVTPSTRVQSLVAGQVDLVAAALPHTHAAAEVYIDFSERYFIDAPALLLPAAVQSLTLEFLVGQTVAAVQGDSVLMQLQASLP
jgi:ABC-type amino acid transport substrate-binding protein